MNLHHIGYACSDIQQTIEIIKNTYSIRSISDQVYDKYQNATICFIEIEKGHSIELVAGERVKNLLKQGITLYHVCYEVASLEKSLELLLKNGGIQVSPVYPAILFGENRVVFVETSLGLVELLEQNTGLGALNIKHESIMIFGTFVSTVVKEQLANLIKKVGFSYVIEDTNDFDLNLELINPKSNLALNTGINIIISRASDFIINSQNSFQKFDTFLESFIPVVKNSKSMFIFCICPSENEYIKHEEVFLRKLEIGFNGITNLALLNLGYLTNNLDYKLIHDAWSEREFSIPYTEHFSLGIAINLLKTVYSFSHNYYKVIIVDCDNTLWGGVCGENDISELQLSEANLYLQEMLVSLQKKGFLIVISSKNNKDVVLNVFNNLSGMILSKEHITEWLVNWKSKHKNLRNLSKTLNLPLSSFIFIDDNPIECREIEINLYEVLVIQFMNSFKQMKIILDNIWEFKRAFTSDQAAENRTIWYKSHIKREQLKKTSFSFSEFIKELNLNIKISSANEDDLERIVELSFRVTQFNVSNRKFHIDELKTLILSNTILIKVELSDKFGDYGIVGAIIAASKNDELEIINFLLSCRALNRGVEHNMLQYLGNFANSLKLNSIRFEFEETLRNTPAIKFLDSYCKGVNQHYNISVEAAINTKFQIDNDKITLHENKFEAIKKNNYIDNNVLKQIYDISEEWNNTCDSFNNDKSITENSYVSNKIINIELIKQIWLDVLNINSIQENSDFFKIGGTSLLALRMISKIYSTYGIRIKLYEFNMFSIFSEFYNKFIKQNKLTVRNSTKYNNIYSYSKKESDESKPALSSSQESLWIIDNLYQSSWFYNISTVYLIIGNINFYALSSAIVKIIDSSDSLRSFVKNDKSNKPIFYVENNPKNYNIELIDGTQYNAGKLSSLISKIQLEGFTLNAYPLYRIKLIRISDFQHILVLVFHHLIFDGWSEGVFNRLLSQLYSNHIAKKTMLIPNEFNYKDFIFWEQQLYSSNIYNNSLKYWLNELKDYQRFNLPTNHPRTNRMTFEGRYLHFNISDNLFKKIRILKHSKNTTLFCILYAAFATTINKISGVNDMVIGIPFSGRTVKNFENVIGNFVNTVPLRTKIETKLSLNEFLLVIHKKIFEAYENQFVPFKQIVKNLSLRRDYSLNPLYNLMFVFQDSPCPKLYLENLEIEYFRRGYDAARMDITLEINIINNSLDGGIYYNTNLFDEFFILDIINEYLNILTIFSEPELEGSKLESIIKTKPQNVEGGFFPLTALFERSANEFPSKIAVKDIFQSLSFLELNNKSNFLAQKLLNAGFKANDKLALHLTRSNDIVTCIIACFKIGVTYIPIDPEYPTNYKNYILDDCKPKAIVSNDNSELNTNHSILDINVLFSVYNDSSKYIIPKINVDLDTIAYILYTSGTTGKPKGVIISHKVISCLIPKLQKTFKINTNDTGVLFHSFCFDVSVWEMWSILAYGGTLIILNNPKQLSSEDFWKFIVKEKISVISQTPTVFENFCVENYLSFISKSFLRLIILAGEPLFPKFLVALINATNDKMISIYNLYGVTEAGIYSTIQNINLTIANSNKSLIGQAIEGVKIQILDSKFNPVSFEEKGEIFISGFGLANGYLNKDDLTKATFIKLGDTYWYRSGDLARYNTSSSIEYLGRINYGNKIRGFRIDPSFISIELEKHPAVQKSFVFVNSKPNYNDLCAIILPNKENALPIVRYFEAIERAPNLMNKGYILSNGMQIFQHNISETKLQYKEIFQDYDYFKFGITVKEHDIVFDIGANIGMFSLFLGNYVKNIEIYAFEPIPELYEILKINLWLYNINSICENLGISDSEEISNFSYYPKVSVLSGKNTDDKEIESLILNTINREELLTNDKAKKIIQFASIKKNIQCLFLPLSNVIEKYNIEKINLIKIDVERNELNVLQGIKPHHWKNIEQVVAEVHDFGDNYNMVCEILRSNGFSVETDIPETIKGSNIIMVYAIRKDSLENINTVNFSSLNNIYNIANENSLINDVKALLKNSIPDYMVPSNIKVISNFPITSNGKIDINYLRCLFSRQMNFLDSKTKSKFLIELSEIESKVLKIWENILNIEIFDLNVNFFDLGGDSLLLIKLHSDLCLEVNHNINIMDLFEHTNIKKQAKFLNSLNSRE